MTTPRARQEQKRNVARVFVAMDDQFGVVGFYSLSSFTLTIAIERARQAPSSVRPHSSCADRPLARDRRVRGQGVGDLLLADAIPLSRRHARRPHDRRRGDGQRSRSLLSRYRIRVLPEPSTASVHPGVAPPRSRRKSKQMSYTKCNLKVEDVREIGRKPRNVGSESRKRSRENRAGYTPQIDSPPPDLRRDAPLAVNEAPNLKACQNRAKLGCDTEISI